MYYDDISFRNIILSKTIRFKLSDCINIIDVSALGNVHLVKTI